MSKAINKLTQATSKPRPRNIPNNVYQTFKSRYVDDKTFNKFELLHQENPQFNFHFYDDVDMDDYMAEYWSHRPIYGIYSNLEFGASRADIWRYCILHDRGGIYLDFDSNVKFLLDDLPLDVNEIISFEGNTIQSAISAEYTPDLAFFVHPPVGIKALEFPEKTVLQWFLAFAPGHPILADAISIIEERADYFRGKTFASAHLAVCNLTGPVIYTKSVWNYVGNGGKVHQDGIDLSGRGVFKDVTENDTYTTDPTRYAAQTNTCILNKELVRLNLGCGGDVRRGWVNIDAASTRPSVRKLNIDQISDEFDKETVDEIFAQDVIEHVGMPTAKRWIATWAALLRPGGKLTVQTPCFESLIKSYFWGKIDLEDLNYFLFSGVSWHDGIGSWDAEQTTPYDWHRCVFSQKKLANELAQNGLKVTKATKDSMMDLKPGNRLHGLNIRFECVKIAAKI